jgi:protein SDA1
MAARSLIQLFRQVNPAILPRKERGKPSDNPEDEGALAYGESRVMDTVPGSELLTLYDEAKAAGKVE